MMIKLTPFMGLVPRTGTRLLPDAAATTAANIRIQSGELRPMRNPQLLYTPASPKNGTQISIFNARNGSSDESWFTWPIDVDCVRVPLATDVESRFCWTGDGVPKWAKYTSAIAGGGSNYPVTASEFTLGIPTPVTAVTVTPSGGTGSNTDRFYRYTFVSQDGEESAPSPVSAIANGKLNGSWAITGMDAVPLNSGVVSSTTRAGDTITAVTSARNWLRVGDSVTVAGVGTMTEANGTFVVTAVASTGLSFSYDVTDAATGSPGGAGTWTRVTPWNTSNMYRRLYRTTGTTGAWQLVSEYVSTDPLYAGWGSATTFTDTYDDTLIAGDEMITEGWVPPPVGLTGLCVHPSGALVGFVGNLLCFSEPLQPHAWPTEYQLSSGYNGVGTALFGTTVVMATQGMPFVATGVEPASMSGEDVQGMYPCLSKRSVVNIGDSVLYASLHGLVSVGARGVTVFTEAWYSRDEWELLNPETMICAMANGRLYVSQEADDGVRGLLIFDGPILTTSTVSTLELYTDVSSGELYLTTKLGIYSWDSPLKTNLQASWKSKDFVFPKPINIGAGKVEFDTAVDPTVQTAILALIAAIEAANAETLAPLLPQTVTAVDAGTDTLTVGAGHGLYAGARVQFANTGGALPTGLSAATDYYALTSGLTTTEFIVTATANAARRATVTITNANPGVVSYTGHGFSANDAVKIYKDLSVSAQMPTGLVEGTTYYVNALTADTFKLAATPGGADIDTTGTQSGTFYLVPVGATAAVNVTDAGSGTNTVLLMDADIGGAFADDEFTGMEYSGSNLQDPPDEPASNIVNVTLWANGKLIASKEVSTTRVFRFPAGYKADTFSVQVTSQCVVKEIRIAETPNELRTA